MNGQTIAGKLSSMTLSCKLVVDAADVSALAEDVPEFKAGKNRLHRPQRARRP